LIGKHDDKPIRCPRIGGEVNFKFCRLENNRLPCRWIVRCWQNRVDTGAFLGRHYSEDELSQIFAQPRPKMETIVELIEKAKKVTTGQ
jgi:hypothetical protein